MSLPKREEFIKGRVEGVKNLYKLRDEIQLPDETGTLVVGRLPNTQFEFLQYINQGKNKLFDMYDSITQQAGDRGLVVPTTNVTSMLKTKLNDKQYDPTQRKYIAKKIKEWEDEGQFTPREAQGRITGMNNTLGDYYLNRPINYKGDAGIDKEILDTFRGSLTNTIQNAGSQYAPLRKAWGSIHSLESDAIRKLEKEAATVSKQDPLNFLAAEQVLYAVAKGNPHYLIPAAGTIGLKSIRKALVSPDRAVRRMFNETEKALQQERILHPNLREPTPVSNAFEQQVPRALPRPQEPIEGQFTQIRPQLPSANGPRLLPNNPAKQITSPHRATDGPSGAWSGNISDPPKTLIDVKSMAKKLYDMGYLQTRSTLYLIRCLLKRCLMLLLLNSVSFVRFTVTSNPPNLIIMNFLKKNIRH
jgi:hypothetical protein